jgi:hypothetical protein
VAGGTPNVGGPRKRRSIAQFLLHTRHSGEDPLHPSAPATQEIATPAAWHILAARRRHARKLGIKYTSSEAPSNVLAGPACRTTERRCQTSVDRVFYARSQNYEERLLTTSCLSAWNNPAPTAGFS